jgi:hypothetical protein
MISGDICSCGDFLRDKRVAIEVFDMSSYEVEMQRCCAGVRGYVIAADDKSAFCEVGVALLQSGRRSVQS